MEFNFTLCFLPNKYDCKRSSEFLSVPYALSLESNKSYGCRIVLSTYVQILICSKKMQLLSKTTCWKIIFQPNWLILCWQTSWKRFPMVQIMIQKRFQLWERWKYFWFFRILVSRRYALKRVSLPFFVQSAYNQIDFKVVFKTTRRLSDLFRIKDSIPKRFKSSVVYGIVLIITWVKQRDIWKNDLTSIVTSENPQQYLHTWWRLIMTFPLMMFRLWPLGIVTLSVRFPLEMFS